MVVYFAAISTKNKRMHSNKQFSIYATISSIFFSRNFNRPSKNLPNSICHFYHVHRQKIELVKFRYWLYIRAIVKSVNDRFWFAASSVWPHICTHLCKQLSGLSQGGRTSQTWHKYGAYIFFDVQIEHTLRIFLVVNRYRPCTHYTSLPPIRRGAFRLTMSES